MADSNARRRHPEHLPVDLSRWGSRAIRWPSLEMFLERPPSASTLHSIGFPSGVVDILTTGDPFNSNRSNIVPIFLTGATADRTNLSGPFFSGATIAIELGVPALSIADPAISDHDLRLAWYSGCSRFDALTAIAATLNGIIETFNTDVLLVGGSGGGFASLALAEIVGERATAFVWNPQTDILDYQVEAVGLWLDSAFADRGVGPLDLETTEGKQVLRRVLDALGVRTQVGGAPSEHKALIVQNTSDHWHLTTHARPYAVRAGLQAHDAIFSDDRRLLAIGDWPGGHVVPPRHVVLDAVRLLLSGGTPLSVYGELIGLHPQLFNLQPRSLESLEQSQFDAFSTPGSVRIEYHGDPSGLTFAFYLNGPSGRLHTHWYSPDPVFEFTGELADRVSGVSCFIRNSISDQRRFEVSVTGSSQVRV